MEKEQALLCGPIIWLPLEAVLHFAEAQLALVFITGSLGSHTEQKIRD